MIHQLKLLVLDWVCMMAARLQLWCMEHGAMDEIGLPDFIGPGHELYPMMKDAMESKGAVFYERDETGKIIKKG